MKIYIQNMVSLRCKMLVKSELKKLNLDYIYVELGVIMLVEPISEAKKKELQKSLHESGLEILNDENSILVQKIINIIVESIHYTDEIPKINFSLFLSNKLQKSYSKLSELFSKTKGLTIENFMQLHKIERVKELITYNKLNLTEISYIMHYSSVAHLSKQITGFTPTFFKTLVVKRRLNLEDL